jgi:hypothetical protein
MAPSGVAISVNSDRLDRSFLLLVVGLSFFVLRQEQAKQPCSVAQTNKPLQLDTKEE